MNSTCTEKSIISKNDPRKAIGNRSLSLPMPSGRHNVIGELFLGLAKEEFCTKKAHRSIHVAHCSAILIAFVIYQVNGADFCTGGINSASTKQTNCFLKKVINVQLNISMQ